MSNTEIVQELYAAFGRGDLPAILAKLDDDVVWESEGPAIVSFSGIRRGKTEAKSFFDALAADHAKPQVSISEYVASDDSVMTLGRYTATMKATGKTLDSPIAHYWRIHNGKVARYVGLVNTAAAVEALQPVSTGNGHGALTVTCTPRGLTAEKYKEVHRRLEHIGEAEPSGRLFHSCYGPEDALRVVDVWADAERFQRFGAILKPILDSVGIELDPSDIDVQPQQNGVVGK
ncbi:MAG: nuclear transport factor 2 family protein [Terracidiphilus sp.]|jgi:ketosteroid isomerase-like protein